MEPQRHFYRMDRCGSLRARYHPGVPRCCGAFTPSTRVVSVRRGRDWFLFRFRGRYDAPRRRARGRARQSLVTGSGHLRRRLLHVSLATRDSELLDFAEGARCRLPAGVQELAAQREALWWPHGPLETETRRRARRGARAGLAPRAARPTTAHALESSARRGERSKLCRPRVHAADREPRGHDAARVASLARAHRARFEIRQDRARRGPRQFVARAREAH